MYIKNLITCFCLIFLLTHCKENPFMKTEKYPYAVTTTASEDYPMEVHIGYFLDEKEELICGVPKTGSVESGWQYQGAEVEASLPEGAWHFRHLPQSRF